MNHKESYTTTNLQRTPRTRTRTRTRTATNVPKKELRNNQHAVDNADEVENDKDKDDEDKDDKNDEEDVTKKPHNNQPEVDTAEEDMYKKRITQQPTYGGHRGRVRE